MKKLTLPALLAVFGAIMLCNTGCSVWSTKGNFQPSMVNFNKGDYTLSDPKSATGEISVYFNFYVTGENDKWGSVPIYGMGPMFIPTGCPLSSCAPSIGGNGMGAATSYGAAGQAVSVALYNLMEQNKGYDGVLAPYYTVEMNYPCSPALPIIVKAKATVTARLIKFNKS